MALVKIINKSPFGKLLILGFVLGVLWIHNAPVRAEIQEESKLTVDLTANQGWVDGPGAANSALSQDAHLNNDISYNYQRSDGTNNFHFGFQGRYTDDRSVDPEYWSLTNLALDWQDPATKLSAGDVMADFSGYSLSGSVKGASLGYQFGSGESQVGRPEIGVVYGVAYPRWDSFWGGPEVKALKRLVGGVNVRDSVSDKADLGLRFVRTDDSDRISDWDQLFQNRIYSFNWEFRPREGMTLKGESAFSDTVESPAAGEPDQSYQGNAHQLAFSVDGKHQKWLYEYELVSPKFTSLAGSAMTDQERMKLTWTGNLNPDLTLSAGAAYSHNDLPESSQTYRTDMFQPQVTLSFITPFHRENASLDLGMRLDSTHGGDSIANNYCVTAEYRDSFGKLDCDLGLEYDFDDAMPYDFGAKSENFMYNLTLGTEVKKEQYTLKPTLNFSFTRNSDLLNHYDDRILESSVGLAYNRPQTNFSVGFKTGWNQNLKESSPDTGKWFGNLRIDGQPKLLRKLGANTKLFLEVNVNNFTFDNAGDNYRETSAVAGLHLEF